LRAREDSGTKAAQHPLQQRLPRQKAHHDQLLDALQPQAGVARPLVKLYPRHARLVQIGFQHDRPPRHKCHARRPMASYK
jgi:hypothetical protein